MSVPHVRIAELVDPKLVTMPRTECPGDVCKCELSEFKKEISKKIKLPVVDLEVVHSQPTNFFVSNRIHNSKERLHYFLELKCHQC